MMELEELEDADVEETQVSLAPGDKEDEEFYADPADQYANVKRRSLYAMNHRDWEYAIQMPAFKKGDVNNVYERTCMEVTQHLVKFLGPDGVGYVKVKNPGNVDVKHCFVKVSMSVDSMEKMAENQGLKVRVNKWMGGGYQPFTREAKSKGTFAHPHCPHNDEASCVCCPNKDEEDECNCLLLLPYQRQQIVKRQIELAFDEWKDAPGKGIALALKAREIMQVYPLHTLERNSPHDAYPSRREVLINYCGWRNSLGTLWAWGSRSKNFLWFLRDYFGEKIALYFAFLHFYSSWLMPLALVGFFVALWQYFDGNADTAGVLVYCLVVAFWSIIMLNFWERHNSFLAYNWNMLDYEETETELYTYAISTGQETEYGFYERFGAWVDMNDYAMQQKRNRPDAVRFIPRFHRDRAGHCPSFLFAICGGSKGQQDEMNTRAWRLFKYMITTSIIACALCAVLAVALSLLILRLIMQENISQKFGGFFAGVLQALAIYFLDGIFRFVAVRLNNWENHRTATMYEDRLIAKMFFFQFVNSYFSLFYIAFFKGGSLNSGDPKFFGYDDPCRTFDGQVTESCMDELSAQLTSMLLTRMFLGNLMEQVYPYLRWRWRIAKRVAKLRRQIKQENPGWTRWQVDHEVEAKGHKRHSVDVAEKQAHQLPYNVSVAVSGTFYDYAELAIQFGYVTLFAPAFPLAPFVAVLNNVMENRTDGFKILKQTQKPDYQGAQDMGTWYAIFRIMASIAVMTNMLILGFTSTQLKTVLGDVLNKDEVSDGLTFAVVVVLEHIIFSIQFFVAYLIPPRPAWLRREIAHTEATHVVGDAYREWKRFTKNAAERESVQLVAAPALFEQPYDQRPIIYSQPPAAEEKYVLEEEPQEPEEQAVDPREDL